MSNVCPKDGCHYKSSEHGLKVHYGRSEDHDGTIADNYYSCRICGKEKYASERDGKFCSVECRNVSKGGFDCFSDYYYAKVDICEYCNDVFEHPSSVNRTFCSRRCSDLGRDTDFSRNMIEVECDECGNKLERHPYRIEKNSNHFCSIECRGAGPFGRNIYIDEIDLYVRSSWEEEFVFELLDRNIDFEYERRFSLENRVYSPDFVIGDIVVEIKGYGDEDDVDKAEEFMDENPEYKYVVIQGSGITIPCDEWYSWDEKTMFLNLQTGV